MVKTTFEVALIKCRVLKQMLIAGEKKIPGAVISLNFAEAHNLKSSGRVEFIAETKEVADQPAGEPAFGKSVQETQAARKPKQRSRKKK